LIETLQACFLKNLQHELLTHCQIAKNTEDETVLSDYIKEINLAHLHPFQGGGKLVRPTSLLLIAGCFGGLDGVAHSYSVASAIECAHTYSLVHDDLPCMDNDSLRRGQPTVHTIYGDSKGLLVGDSLLTVAFKILSSCQSFPKKIPLRSDLIIQLISIFSEAIGMQGMVFGQWLDISESEIADQSLNQNEKDQWIIFQTIHKNKTGKLFAASFVMGLLCGLYSKETLPDYQNLEFLKKEFFNFGIDIGLAFQIIDDILDTTQSSEILGKTSGKDLSQQKLTAVKILGIDRAQKYAENLIDGIENKMKLISEKNTAINLDASYSDELICFLKKLKTRVS